MSNIQWGQYHEAYKAIHDRLLKSLAWIENLGNPRNGSFETGDFTSWIVESDGIAFISTEVCVWGKYAAQLKWTGAVAQGILQLYYPAMLGKDTFELSIFVKKKQADGRLYAMLFYSDGTTSNPDFSPTEINVYQKWVIPFDSTKNIAGVKFYPGWADIWIDHYAVSMKTAGLSDLEESIKKYERYVSAEQAYYDADVPAGGYITAVDISGNGIVEALSISAEHSDIITWIGFDGYYWMAYVYNGSPSFTSFNGFGGEDSLFKMHQYTAGGRCSMFMKRPQRFTSMFRVEFENPTPNPVRCRVDGLYRLI